VDEDGRAGNNAAASEVQQGVGRRGGRRALSAAEVRRLSEGLRPPTLPLMRETPTTAMWGDEESEDGGVLVDVGRRSGEQLGLSQRRGHESHQTGEASGSLHHNTEAARQEAMQIRDKLLDEFQCKHGLPPCHACQSSATCQLSCPLPMVACRRPAVLRPVVPSLPLAVWARGV
jgi:general stress protein YciG